MSQTEFYRNLIEPNDIVYDIGANIGDKSAIFSPLCSKVIAVEPQKQLAANMIKRFAGTNVTVVNSAVSDRDGEATLYRPHDDTMGRSGVGTLSAEFMTLLGPSIFNLTNGWDVTETVSLITAHQLFMVFGKPDFIKIDIEGYEKKFLLSMAFKPRALSFEFHPELLSDVLPIIAHLTRLGFKEFNYCTWEKYEYHLPIWVNGIELLQELEQYRKKVIYGDVYAR